MWVASAFNTASHSDHMLIGYLLWLVSVLNINDIASLFFFNWIRSKLMIDDIWCGRGDSVAP